MTRRTSWAGIFFVTVGGCAASAANLQLDEMTRDQGALFGHLVIKNADEDITDDCYLDITSEQGVEKGRLSLDADGWVFTAVKTGPTYLSGVTCTLGGLVKYNTHRKIRSLRLDVPAGKQIAYFGHVTIDLHSDGSAVTAATLLLGGLGHALAEDTADRSVKITIADRFDDAKREYQKRYGRHRRKLEPMAAIPQEQLAAATVPEPAPAKVLGFVVADDAALSAARCSAAGLEWQTLDDAHATCSGAPSTAIAGKATLTMGAGMISEIAFDANPDDARWLELVQRFVTMTQFLEQELGAQHQRASTPLDDCTDGIKRCFAAGRARTSVTWLFRYAARVSLVLDGGPIGEKPTLTVLYHAPKEHRVKP